MNYLSLHAVFNYLIRVGDGISQFLNVAVLFGTNPNESISGRAYRMQNVWVWSKVRIVIDWLFLPFENDHCKKAHDADISRAAQLMRNQRF